MYIKYVLYFIWCIFYMKEIISHRMATEYSVNAKSHGWQNDLYKINVVQCCLCTMYILMFNEF